MTDIKLSLCIPTFNRARFLEHLLGTFIGLSDPGFTYEIVISDNASTDDTTDVVRRFIERGLPITYFRRPENGDGWPNLANAYAHARGEYSLYLADDDFLVWENLGAAVKHLDQNPDMIVCHAPWYIHDAVENRDVQLFYQIDKPQHFKRGNFGGLFSFIVERHIFPEIGIYRTAALRTVFVPRYFCFWAFAYVAEAIDMGTVGFFNKPFYRCVTRSKIVRDREQAGHEEVMTAWDRYRGGLEYLLHRGALRNKIDLNPQTRAIYDRACTIFMMTRMSVALRMWYARKEYLKAYELYARLAYAGFGNLPEVKQIAGHLPLMASVQALVEKVNGVSDVKFVVLDSVTSIDSLAGLMAELGLNKEIEVIAPPAERIEELAPVCAVFTADASRRAFFERQGYRPGLILSEAEITGPFSV